MTIPFPFASFEKVGPAYDYSGVYSGDWGQVNCW
jgi:hypothetical protein